MSDIGRLSSLAVDPSDVRVRDRNLVAPPPVTTTRAMSSEPSSYASRLGFIAVVLTFLLPANLLVNFGVYSEFPGGNPLTKFHPATYVAVLAAWLALYGRRHGPGMTGLFRDRPALAWAVALIVAAMIYSGFNFGIGGMALYVESYLGAALLLIAIETGTERQLRALGYVILTFALVNVAISVLEAKVATHMIAPYSGAEDLGTGEFRGAALYAHPLTGALVTSMVLLMVLGMRLRTWVTMVIVGVLFVGLMSFGGRTSLFMTVLMIAAAGLFQLSAGLLTRRLSVGFLAAFIAGSVLLPTLFLVLTSMTDIGQRILTHLYFDDSAEIRVIQWHVLNYLKPSDFLFGISPDRIELLKFQIGLSKPGMDIENFWLLMFLNLGAFGFAIYTGALFLFLLHQGHRVNTPIGWMIVIATLLICSTSNSLGRKVPDLYFLAAVMTALGGFKLRLGQPLVKPAEPQVATDPLRRAGLPVRADGRVRALADGPLARPAALRSGPGLA